MKNTVRVAAAPGLRCPMEKDPRKYITDSVPVEVPRSPFYLRLLADGSLVQAGPAPKPLAQEHPAEKKRPAAAKAGGKED